MVADPLFKSLEAWTRSDLDELIGRAESEYLELKGSRLGLGDDGRAKVSQAIAGFISASGGFIIVGTDPNSDSVLGYPGIKARDDDIESFRRSLVDQVRPGPPLFRGPRSFEADDPSKQVLVIQVLQHPTGLPASAGGRYYLRQGPTTVPMDYDEVRRRVEAAAVRMSAASGHAETELDEVGAPIARYFRGELERMGKPEVTYTPMTLAVVPAQLRDLGLNGVELRKLLEEAAQRELDSYVSNGLEPHAESLIEGLTRNPIRVAGVDADLTPYRRIRIDHQGIFAASHNLIFNPWDDGVALNPQTLELITSRFCALALPVIHRANGPTSVHVSVRSGTILAVLRNRTLLIGEEATHRNSEAQHQFDSSSAGLGAVEAVLHGCEVIAARASDAASLSRSYTPEPKLRSYLEELL